MEEQVEEWDVPSEWDWLVSKIRRIRLRRLSSSERKQTESDTRRELWWQHGGRVAASWEEMCGVKRVAWLVPWHQEKKERKEGPKFKSDELLFFVMLIFFDWELEFFLQPLAYTSVSFLSHSPEVIISQHFIFHLHCPLTFTHRLFVLLKPSPSLICLHKHTTSFFIFPSDLCSTSQTSLIPSLSFPLFTILCESITTTTFHAQCIISPLDFLLWCHGNPLTLLILILIGRQAPAAIFWIRISFRVEPKHASSFKIFSEFLRIEKQPCWRKCPDVTAPCCPCSSPLWPWLCPSRLSAPPTGAREHTRWWSRSACRQSKWRTVGRTTANHTPQVRAGGTVSNNVILLGCKLHFLYGSC